VIVGGVINVKERDYGGKEGERISKGGSSLKIPAFPQQLMITCGKIFSKLLTYRKSYSRIKVNGKCITVL
jgi:hypothetical protein